VNGKECRRDNIVVLSEQARKERGCGDGHIGRRTVSTSIVLYADGDTEGPLPW